MPRIRPASRSGWKTSRASVFSPVPRNLTGTPVTAEMRQRGAAAGVAVDLGQDEAGDGHGGDERLGDADGLLAGHGIDDEQRLDRLDRRVDGGDLGHERLVDAQAAGGVEDHDVADLALGGLDALAGDVRRRDVPDRRAVDRDVERLAERLELVRGGRAVRVGGDEERPAALLDDVAGELGRGRRLARALQADHRDDGRVARSGGRRGRPCRAARRARRGRSSRPPGRRSGSARTSWPMALLADPGDEVLDDLEVDVRLEQGQADLAHGGVDVGLADPAAAGQAAEGRCAGAR